MNSVALAIKVTADASAAANGIDGVTTKTSKMGQAGKVAGRLLAAGLLVAGAAAVKATQAAAEDEAAQSKLAGALRNATGARDKDIASVEKWITAQGTAFGVADSELRPSLEALVTATKDVTKAQDLASIAMDIAARKGESVESVSKKLAKAYATGNVGALAKYGIATKDAAGKTKSFEQVQLDLAKTYKGAASDAADTAAGKQKKLSVAMGELQEEIGAKLLPVMLKLTSAGLAVVDWITKNQAAAAAIIGTIGGLLAVVKLVSVATKVWSAVTKVATAVQAAFNLVMSLNPVALVVIAVVALAAALVLAYKKSETFRNIVNAVFGAVARFATNAWDKIKGGAEAVWEKLKTGFTTVKEKVEDVTGKIKDAFQTAFEGVQGFIQSVIDKIQSLIDKIQSAVDKLKQLASGGGSGGIGQLGGRAGAGFTGGIPTNTGITRTPSVVVNVTVPGGFIGDEQQLAVKLRRILGDHVYRVGP